MEGDSVKRAGLEGPLQSAVRKIGKPAKVRLQKAQLQEAQNLRHNSGRSQSLILRRSEFTVYGWS